MDRPQIAGGPVVVAVLLSLLLPAAGGEDVENPAPGMQRSISASGQCIVYGRDAHVRGAFCVFGEGVRKALHKSLDLDGSWKFPVVIQIHTQLPLEKPGRYVRGRVNPMERGYRFQLDVLLDEGFTREAMTEELLRLLLLELMLRSEPNLEGMDESRRLLPHWMHYGILELVRYNQEGTPNELFASLLSMNKVLEIDEILSGDPAGLDSISRAVFEASSAAFVKTLLGTDAGAQRLLVTLQALPVYKGSQRDMLARYFPALAASGDSLEKWWALEMATLGQRDALDFLDPEETQARLREALTVEFHTPVKTRKARRGEEAVSEGGELVVCALGEFDNFIGFKEEERARILADNRLALLELSVESFPLYRGIVAEYRRLLDRIVEGKKWGLAKKFEEVDARTIRLGEKLRDIEDYMNWFEATQLSEKSGAFSDYKKAVEQLRREEPRRADRISGFLDSLEGEKGD